MGGSLTVAVGGDTTTIGGDVLSEYGRQMVELVADVVRNPKFPESELPRLKANLTPQPRRLVEPAAADRPAEIPGGDVRRPRLWPALSDRGV